MNKFHTSKDFPKYTKPRFRSISDRNMKQAAEALKVRAQKDLSDLMRFDFIRIGSYNFALLSHCDSNNHDSYSLIVFCKNDKPARCSMPHNGIAPIDLMELSIPSQSGKPTNTLDEIVEFLKHYEESLKL